MLKKDLIYRNKHLLKDRSPLSEMRYQTLPTTQVTLNDKQGRTAHTQHKTNAPLVLIVEDERHHRFTLYHILKQNNLQVAEARDGKEALELLETIQADLILMDTDMPTMNGFETCRAIRKDPRTASLPIIMTTHLQDPESVDRAFRAGAEDYITKPINFTVLIKRIKLILENIQHNKNNEEKRQWADRSFQLMVENVLDYAIVVLDPKGIVMSWNIGAERIQGYHAKEIIGLSCTKFYPVEEIRGRKFQRDLEKAARIGRLTEEGWRIRKNGARFWAKTVYTACHDRQGSLRGFIQLTHDMTHYKQNEEERIKAVNEFIGFASHDLQEPLRTLRNYITLLREDVLACLTPGQTLSMDAAEDMKFIFDAAQRMSGLVQSMIDMMRLGNHPIQLKRIDLNHCLKAVLADLKTTILEKKADIHWQTLPTLYADGDLIHRVLQNLIGNALKFCTNRPIITLSAHENAWEWRISVSDNGIGIDPENITKIFTSFQRSHNHTNYPGNGVGLSIAKKSMERHGGRLTVSSQVGQGSIFTLSIPKNEEEIS